MVIDTQRQLEHSGCPALDIRFGSAFTPACGEDERHGKGNRNTAQSSDWHGAILARFQGITKPPDAPRLEGLSASGTCGIKHYRAGMQRHRILITLLSAALLTLSACSTSDQSTQEEDPTAVATELIDRYALAVFDRDPEALGELLSDAYLLRRSDGSGYDRQGYMDALKEGSNYELVNYQITDITAQQDGDILVAMFTLDADIEENGRSVLSTPSPSLVTFVRVDGEWKLASDAFFSR